MNKSFVYYAISIGDAILKPLLVFLIISIWFDPTTTSEMELFLKTFIGVMVYVSSTHIWWYEIIKKEMEK